MFYKDFINHHKKIFISFYETAVKHNSFKKVRDRMRAFP